MSTSSMLRKLKMLKPLSLILLLPFLQGCSGHGGAKLLWQAPIASETTPIVSNGTVYIRGFHAGHPQEEAKLFALDAETGKERWVSADAVKEVYGETGGSVFFLNKAGHLVQLNAQTGEKLHESTDSNLRILRWAIRGDRMYVVNGSQEVVALDSRQNKELWRRKLPIELGTDTDLQLEGEQVIVSGHFKDSVRHFGMLWALDAATGHEQWHFEAPPPQDFAPLKVLAHGNYILATNTAPLTLHTHVLDAHTGKELYTPIGIFDLVGFHGDTVYASSGAYNLHTGQRTGEKAEWVSGSVVHNNIAWKRHYSSVGAAEAFLLRSSYDGDYQGSRDWTHTPPNSSLEGFDVVSGKSLYHTQECKYTQFSDPVEADGVLYHTSIAMMKEGQSGVWAFRLP